jgi:hypothetical protein
MKRLHLLLLLLLAPLALGFTSITVAFSPATPLVWYEAHADFSSAATEGRDFIPRFLPYGQFGLDGGGTFFGTDSYQFDTITCSWESPGVVSGGTDVMRVQLLQKSDAGVVCTCDLPGICSDAAGSEHTCACGSVKYLTDVTGLKAGYAIQLSSSTNCATNPSSLVCAIPFRK